MWLQYEYVTLVKASLESFDLWCVRNVQVSSYCLKQRRKIEKVVLL